MSDDERVLRSFVGEDETLRGIWTITKVSRSKGQIPPSAGTRSIAVTDERVLWFTSELDAVQTVDVDDVELEFIERQTAPPMVLGGGLLFAVGVVGSIGAFVAGLGDLLVVGLPALTGLGVFLGSRVVASMTGRKGEILAGHRLRLWIDDDPLSVWGDDEDRMAAIRAAITGESIPGADRDADPTELETADVETDQAGEDDASDERST